jgi:hypothetical protein
LDRFGIVEGPMYVCLQDYETVDHLIWHCERFGSKRHRLVDALSMCYIELQFGICVVYESEVPSNVVWASSEVLKSDFEICFIGPSASGPFRITDTFKKKKK